MTSAVETSIHAVSPLSIASRPAITRPRRNADAS
jgi:hypothetical protein